MILKNFEFSITWLQRVVDQKFKYLKIQKIVSDQKCIG